MNNYDLPESNASPAVAEEKPQYILTKDIRHKVQLLKRAGLIVPGINDQLFDEIDNGIASRLQRIFGVDCVRIVEMRDLAERIMAMAKAQQSLDTNTLVISTCSEIAAPEHGFTIELNRIYDQTGNFLGLGPRPGHPPLDEQLEAIIADSRGRLVILVEDGTFTGSTLAYIVKKLKGKVDISAIVIGFLFAKGKTQLEEIFHGKLINIERHETFIDWMPDYDFFPFMPNCGRVLGLSWNGTIIPLYSCSGSSYSVPYVLPFSPMSDWTGIPEEHCLDFSHFCLYADLRLFEQIGQLSGHKVTIKDLSLVRPRISIPLALDDKTLPNSGMQVTEWIKAYLDYLT